MEGTSHRTFSTTTPKTDLKCERAQSRERICAQREVAIDMPVMAKCGQVSTLYRIDGECSVGIMLILLSECI